MPTPPIIRLPDAQRPGASGATWCVALVAAATLLDAVGSPLRTAVVAPVWLDAAALACLVRAALLPGALRRRAEWRTPLDGLVMGAFALATLLALLANGADGTQVWFQHVVACGVFYYGLSTMLRRDVRAIESVWRVLAAVAVVLGLAALWGAIGGHARFTAEVAAVDAHWAGPRGLAKALLFVTAATAGRALERGAPAGWRLALIVGVIGLVIHAFHGGFGLAQGALARLDDPLEFSVEIITLLLTFAAARLAWALRRDVPDEAPRWRMLTLAILMAGGAGVLGDGGAGEGVRALAVLASSAVVATPLARREARERLAREDEAEPARRRAA